MKIPIRNSEANNEEDVISSFLGEKSKKGIKIKVVHEKSVEEIDDTLKRVAESFNKLSQPVKDEATSTNRVHPLLENKKKTQTVEASQKRAISSIGGENAKEEEWRKSIEKRKQAQEQTAKENRRIVIFIIIAILGAIMLFNAKCSKSKSSHHYDHFDPSMEYRHSD
jgi:L-lactate utilization protein LutC